MKRILLYCLNFTGTGHFVRTHQIALALAQDHDVYMVDGGRPVPRPETTGRLTWVPLPRVFIRGIELHPYDAGRSIQQTMHNRREAMLHAIDRIRPDVLMIEHFPISKWLLCDEVIPVLERARQVNRGVKIICSIRDAVPPNRYDPDEDQRRGNALWALHTHFDLLLIHGDPRVTVLKDHVPWADEIRVPIKYTGYIAQHSNGSPVTPAPPPSGDDADADETQRPVIVSFGGNGQDGLLPCAIEAWKRLVARNAVGRRTMTVFMPLYAPPTQLKPLPEATAHPRIKVTSFTTDFLNWMRRADLSISQAGYNTCTNFLQTRTRTILVPNPKVADQSARSRRLAELGLARVIDPAELTPDRMADAIMETLATPQPWHEIDLNGAQKTREILETL